MKIICENLCPSVVAIGTANFAHPRKQLVTPMELARLIATGGLGGFWLEEKMDGDFAMREARDGLDLVAGEIVRRKSGGFYTGATRALLARSPQGVFFAFDVLRFSGADVRLRPLRDRRDMLVEILAREPSWQAVPSGRTGQFYADVIAGGGEGVVLKDMAAPYGEMWAVKRGEIYLCQVTSTGGTQSVGIGLLPEEFQPPRRQGTKGEILAAIEKLGELGVLAVKPCGNVKLGGGKCDQVQVGSIIRVEGMGLTDTGKIRQPVPCREWLVKHLTEDRINRIHRIKNRK